jgi:hypothetical protein
MLSSCLIQVSDDETVSSQVGEPGEDGYQPLASVPSHSSDGYSFEHGGPDFIILRDSFEYDPYHEILRSFTRGDEILDTRKLLGGGSSSSVEHLVNGEESSNLLSADGAGDELSIKSVSTIKSLHGEGSSSASIGATVVTASSGPVKTTDDGNDSISK